MDEEAGVTIENGVIHIDHASIEARLAELAGRWNVTMEEALDRTLDLALRDAPVAEAA